MDKKIFYLRRCRAAAADGYGREETPDSKEGTGRRSGGPAPADVDHAAAQHRTRARGPLRGMARPGTDRERAGKGLHLSGRVPGAGEAEPLVAQLGCRAGAGSGAIGPSAGPP